jgi:hypothetical protein
LKTCQVSGRDDDQGRHLAVDDGEQRPGKPKASPLLVAEGRFDARRVHRRLEEGRAALPPGLAGFALAVLARHPDFATASLDGAVAHSALGNDAPPAAAESRERPA